MSLHTILGAGGAIANELLPILMEAKQPTRIVARHPKQIIGVESVSADLSDADQTLEAVKGSSVVYLLVGLEYDYKVWAEKWPLVMTNTINACKATGAKLIFFDNVYMYGKVNGKMTEETAFNPCSKKGVLRATIVQQLLNEIKLGALTGLVARSADFYGTAATKTSVPNMLVFDNFSKGKKAQWLADAELPHSFTYIPDAGKALYLLAKDESAFNQTWHLPTCSNPLTGAQFIALAAEAMHQPNKFTVLSKFMIRLAGLFIKPIKESYEMIYQSDSSYVFDSSKFEKHFGYTPTSYEDGIKETAKYYL
ncbi:MAG: NmrA family NAD(P)-binding protein [Bacteroidetes bacterium]|nr:NmrA family NAD(P)-binding protein [Bacteroidota bacterium]